MIKNTAGQKIGAQMVSATDGSAFTGSVTVAVTIDAGTQATGSVGSGACTHEGNGYHTYAPAQAETNGTLIAFTFTGTGAVPATVQVFTTGYDPTATAIAANVTAMASDVLTSTALAASAVTEIQSGLSTLDAAGVRTAVGLAAANLDTQLTTIDDLLDTEVAAIKAKTDQLVFTTANRVDATAITVSDKTGYSIASGGIGSGAIAAAEQNALADAFLDRNMATGTDNGTNSTAVRTVRQALRRMRNKESIAAGTLTVTKEDDSTTSWTAAVTTTAGDPLSAVDPT